MKTTMLFVVHRMHTNMTGLCEGLGELGIILYGATMRSGISELKNNSINSVGLSESSASVFLRRLMRVHDRDGLIRWSFASPFSIAAAIHRSRADCIYIKEAATPLSACALLAAVLTRVRVVIETQKPVSYTRGTRLVLRFALSLFFGRRIAWITPCRLDDGEWLTSIPFAMQIVERRPRWNYSEGAPVRLLTVAKWVPRKRHDRSLHILSGLIVRGITARLTFIGECSTSIELQNRARIKEMAETLGLSDMVTYKECVPPTEMAEVYNSHDVLVLLSDRESASVSQLEAMRSGCMAIVLKSNGTSEYVPSAWCIDDSGDVINVSIEVIASAVSNNDPEIIPNLEKFAHKNVAGKLLNRLSLRNRQ